VKEAQREVEAWHYLYPTTTLEGGKWSWTHPESFDPGKVTQYLLYRGHGIA
jgi:hypothetical protein